MLSFRQFLIESASPPPPVEFPGIDPNQWANPYSNKKNPISWDWREIPFTFTPYESPIDVGQDTDGDGLLDGTENEELNPDFDDDNDGVGNGVDMDDDGDNIPDWMDQDWLDNHPSIRDDPANFVDSDGDGIPDFWDQN